MKSIKNLEMQASFAYLQPRAKDSHKGSFGHVLIIGGDLGYAGAIRLAGEAALRVGAGCVSLATRPEHALMLNATRPELMCHGISSAAELEPLLARATFIVIGPGLGTQAWGHQLLKAIIAEDKPCLFDADALNLLALMSYQPQRAPCIFTPHPGEAARLLKTTSSAIQQNRVATIRQLADLLGGIVVLKGHGTLLISHANEPEICTAGNPGMATAGMGDVLSGMIAGFAAQHIPLIDAARLGVLIHAMAGDMSAKAHGERGMLASDLIDYLRPLVNRSN